MKRIRMAVVFLALTGFVSILSVASADVNADFSKIKNQLTAKGLGASDINAIEGPAKGMLGLGLDAADIKNAVLEFSNKGFKGTSLESLMNMVYDLVKSGDNVNLAKTIVAQAADKAKASGAKEDTWIAKIREIVQKHKDSLGALKSKAASAWGGLLKTTKQGGE